jgi:hypothetical protein
MSVYFAQRRRVVIRVYFHKFDPVGKKFNTFTGISRPTKMFTVDVLTLDQLLKFVLHVQAPVCKIRTNGWNQKSPIQVLVYFLYVY